MNFFCLIYFIHVVCLLLKSNIFLSERGRLHSPSHQDRLKVYSTTMTIAVLMFAKGIFFFQAKRTKKKKKRKKKKKEKKKNLGITVTVVRKGTQQPKFKSWKELFAFHFMLIPLLKA